MPLKIGLVSYLNTAPLIFALPELIPEKEWFFYENHPTALNRFLEKGKLDLALISSYAYAQGDYLLIPDVSISATGRVGSVLLFSSLPLDKMTGQEILLTPASATSVALLKLLIEDFCGQRPIYRTGFWTQKEKASAYLAIGDEALKLRRRTPFKESHDLAALWLEHTGLPFVFAVFAVRKDSWHRKKEEIKRFVQILYWSRAKGLASLKELSQQCVNLSGLSSGECLSYLKGIEYDLSGLKQEALTIFFTHLKRRGELSRVPPLKFLPI